MIDRDKYRNYLLANMYGATVGSGGDEVICKCMYCPDDGDHYHMNISIPSSESDLSFFNCWKCHTSGVVTYMRLLEWGIFDSSIGAELTAHNSGAFNSNPFSRIELSLNKRIDRYVMNEDTEVNRMKVQYINDRLGLNLSIKDTNENNIILDLLTFLHHNYIYQYTRDDRVIQSLSDNFLGFLSADGCFVNLRRLVEEGMLYKTIDKKYINYNILGKKDNTMKFIQLPTMYDYLKPTQVHIAEGPFDILSIKYNLRMHDYDNNYNYIFMAATGNTYLQVIRYVLTYLGIINMELHIYPDSDKAGAYKLKSILDIMKPYSLIPIYFHYNTIEKDMGVRRDQIEEIVERRN